jgi:hypothetical protein
LSKRPDTQSQEQQGKSYRFGEAFQNRNLTPNRIFRSFRNTKGPVLRITGN